MVVECFIKPFIKRRIKQNPPKRPALRIIPNISFPIFGGVKRIMESSPDTAKMEISKYKPVSFKPFT